MQAAIVLCRTRRCRTTIFLIASALLLSSLLLIRPLACVIVATVVLLAELIPH